MAKFSIDDDRLIVINLINYDQISPHYYLFGCHEDERVNGRNDIIKFILKLWCIF